MGDIDKYVIASGFVSSYICVQGLIRWRDYSRLKDGIVKLTRQRVYTPDEIIGMFKNNDEIVESLFKKSEDGMVFEGKELIIQGQIKNDDCMFSLVSSKKDVQLVMRVNYEYPYFTDQQDYRVLSEKAMESEYYLKRKDLAKNVTSRIQSVIHLQKNAQSISLLFD